MSATNSSPAMSRGARCAREAAVAGLAGAGGTRPLHHAAAARVSGRRTPGRPLIAAVPQEADELHALAQPPFHHLRAAHHLRRHLRDLPGPEVELLVEGLDGVVDLSPVQ